MDQLSADDPRVRRVTSVRTPFRRMHVIMRPLSLALRLTVWYAATAFLLVAAVAWVQYRTLRSDLAGEDDQLLIETLAAARRSVAAGTTDTLQVGASSTLVGPVVRWLDEQCHVVVGARTADLPPAQCDSAGGVTGAATLRTWISPTGRLWRIASQRVVAPIPVDGRRPAPAFIDVLLDRWTDAALLEGYRRELTMLLGAALAGSALLGFWIARRGLRPLQTLASAMSRVDVQALDHPIDMTGTADGAPTEVIALVASFETMRERLNRAFAALTQFSTELAHEFRTPLHILLQQTEVALSRSRTPDEYRDVLASSLEELHRLNRMVDDILFLARAEDPRARINRTSLPVATELADIVDYLEPLASEGGVGLVAEPAEAIVVSADRMLLRRALVNVVTNAIRHTPSGGTVTLAAERRGEAVAIEVRDTGMGIPAAELSRVFDRYFRVMDGAFDTAADQDIARDAERTGGTGLGLAIVRGIMSLHGGTASVRSTPGRGTWVTLVFPSTPGGERAS